LKTSVRYFLAKEFRDGVPEELKPNLCASVQAAIVDVLSKKCIKAAAEYKVKSIVIAGGVSANSGLRAKLNDLAKTRGIKVIAPDLIYCTDNAGMIGFIAEKKLETSKLEDYRDLTFRVSSNSLRAKRKKKN
ncbi:MAG: hypothetical protein KAH48_11475, partial [Chlorobi bacterium]|nr:hypothetical protein [Chlorobiota bacterium]